MEAMNNLKTLLQGLKEISSSPLALIGYVTLVIAWVSYLRQRSRLSRIKDVPRGERSEILEREFEIRPRKGISAEQWLRMRTHKFLFSSFLVTLAFVIVLAWLWTTERQYHIALQLEDEQKHWIDDAQVDTSVPSIIRKGTHSWQIEISEVNKPRDGRVLIHAENHIDFLNGSAQLTLDSDHSPSVLLTMKKDRSARAIGRIVDEKGKPISEGLVYVIGFENEAVRTSEGGQFDLPAHAAPLEWIRIHIEKDGYRTEDATYHAGVDSSPIVLTRKMKNESN